VKVASYVRANLAVAYAKALLNRKIYDEAIESCGPSSPSRPPTRPANFFTRAVAEVHPDDEEGRRRERPRLLDDVADAPERYAWWPP